MARALLALYCGLILLVREANAAQLTLPPVLHYELPPPALPQPAAPPRYTEHNDQGQSSAAKEYGKSDQPKSFGERLTDDPVAFATLMLTGVTGILAASTIGLWIVTGRSVRIAEKALTDVERPYIFVFGVDHIIKQFDNGTHGTTYAVGNFGKTPAIIERVRAGFTPGDSGIPSVKPDSAQQSHQLLSAHVIRPDEIVTDIAESASGIGIGLDRQYYFYRPLDRSRDFFFWVIIEYNGPFTRGHVTSSCWIFDDYPSGFRCLLDASYTHLK